MSDSRPDQRAALGTSKSFSSDLSGKLRKYWLRRRQNFVFQQLGFDPTTFGTKVDPDRMNAIIQHRSNHDPETVETAQRFLETHGGEMRASACPAVY